MTALFAVLLVGGLVPPTPLPARHATLAVNSKRSSSVGLCATEDDEEMDWREMRARLVAGEQGAAAPSEGFVYESPLIEQGSVILGGTKQDFGFALR